MYIEDDRFYPLMNNNMQTAIIQYSKWLAHSKEFVEVNSMLLVVTVFFTIKTTSTGVSTWYSTGFQDIYSYFTSRVNIDYYFHIVKNIMIIPKHSFIQNNIFASHRYCISIVLIYVVKNVLSFNIICSFICSSTCFYFMKFNLKQ